MPTTTTAATLLASCRHCYRCHCAAAMLPAMLLLPMMPQCYQAAKLAAATTLPPPLAPPRYPCRPAAALPSTNTLLRCHRCRLATTAITALSPSLPRCPRIRCHAATATTVLSSQLPWLCRRSAATACCHHCLCFYRHHRHCRRRCHGIKPLHHEDGKEDECGSKQRIRAAHRRGDAPPPTPRRYPDFVVGIA